MEGAKLSASVVMVMLLISTAAESGHAITCSQVAGMLIPCTTYLTAASPTPLPACCSGVRSLQAATPRRLDRQQACNCLKQAAGRIRNLRLDRASSLPGRCGVRFGVPISLSTNCAKIP